MTRKEFLKSIVLSVVGLLFGKIGRGVLQYAPTFEAKEARFYKPYF